MAAKNKLLWTSGIMCFPYFTPGVCLAPAFARGSCLAFSDIAGLREDYAQYWRYRGWLWHGPHRASSLRR